jgi:DNA-binding NarL/FixJ family response regulator
VAADDDDSGPGGGNAPPVLPLPAELLAELTALAAQVADREAAAAEAARALEDSRALLAARLQVVLRLATSPTVAAAMAPVITDTERRLLHLLAQGTPRGRVHQQLGVPRSEVDRGITRLKQLLGATSVLQVMAAAGAYGWV